jgi:hypothetical protein
MLGVTFNQFVNIACAIGRNAKEIVCEALDLVGDFVAFCPEGAAHVIRTLLAHISLKEHLQDQFAGFAAGAQNQFSAFSRQISA